MSQHPVTVTPVLSSTVGYISDVRDQVAAVLRYMLVNPGFTSSLWEEDLVSFRVLSSKYDLRPEELVNHLNLGLTGIYKRMFPDYFIENNMSLESYEEKDGVMVRTTEDFDVSSVVRYSITFEITIYATDISPSNDIPEEGSLAIVSGNFVVDPATNIITVNFNSSVDTDFISNA